MKHLRTVLAPALVLSAVLATSAHAQNPLPVSFELRGGASFPTGDFADGVSTGWNVGASVLYAAQPNLAVYLGFQHDAFSVDDDGSEDVDVGIDDNGFRGGLRVLLGTMGTVRPWVEGGVLFNRVSVKGSDGDVSASVDSDWKVGFEAGAGFSFDLSPKVALTPGVRYRQHGVSFDDIDEDANGDLKSVVVDLGISIHP